MAATPGWTRRSCSRWRAPQSARAPSPYAVHRAIRPKTNTSPRVRASRRRGVCFSCDCPRSGGAGGSWLSRVRPARAVTSRPITVSASRCRVGDKEPATSAPSPAPIMPPRLNAAWKLGMTGRRSAATRSTAALFMATLIPPYAAPNTSRTSPSATAECVSGGRATLSASRMPQTTVTGWLPKRRHNRPVSVMVITAPAETPSSASPRSLTEAPVCSLMAGMRTTQPAKTKPSRAKKAVRAPRRRGGRRGLARHCANGLCLLAAQSQRRWRAEVGQGACRAEPVTAAGSRCSAGAMRPGATSSASTS